jgi:probable rRNA maturation factor
MLDLTVQDCHPDSPINPTDWDKYFRIWLAQPDLGLPVASSYEIALRLTDDREVQEINSQYRQQDKATDVLSFSALDEAIPLPAELMDESRYLGDIIISVDTAQRQALVQEHPLRTELLWLASHGFLHLLGWDHPDEATLEAMLNCQDRLLGTIGVVITTDSSK